MQIKLINCKANLLAMGIDMQSMGSGSLLNDRLSQKFAYESWEYDFNNDTLFVAFSNETIISDMSAFGELIINDSPLG